MSAMWLYFATVFHLFPDTCLTPHMTSLQVFCMEYKPYLFCTHCSSCSFNTFQCCHKDGLNGTCDFQFLSPVPLLFYLTLVLVAFHLGNMEVHLSYMLFYSAPFLALSIAIAYVKPYKSGYMNFSLCFHSAVWELYVCFVNRRPHHKLFNISSFSATPLCPDDCCLLHTEQDTFYKNNDPTELRENFSHFLLHTQT